jgi:hypothetical protein
MRSADGRAQWTAVMIAAIRKSRCTYFRVHDSGDMFNVAYAACWLDVCRNCRRSDSGFRPVQPVGFV